MQNNIMIQNALLSTAFQRYPRLMVLKIFIDSNDDTLLNTYNSAIENHNNKILSDDFPDSGFDIFVPNDVLTLSGKLNKINFAVKCASQMYYDNGNNYTNTGFYMYPRSSLSGTPLRLANSVGIIDSGYRGPLIGAFDCFHLPDNDSSNLHQYSVAKFNKLVQVCAPGLEPIYVILVNSEAELSQQTSRGSNGFGSTST